MIKISEILGYCPIDIHSHLDHGVPGDHTALVPASKIHTHITTPEHLRQCYDTVGIGKVAFSTYSSCLLPESVPEENRFLQTLAQKENPAYFDVLPLSLEEIFIYELGGVDYEVKNIIL